MNEKDELKSIEKKIGSYSNIKMRKKEFDHIHHNLINRANSYNEYERKNYFLKKHGINFITLSAALITLVLTLSYGDFIDTKENVGQVNSKVSTINNINEMDNTHMGFNNIKDLKEAAIKEVLEKYPNKLREDLRVRIGKIIEINENKNTVLFEGELSEGSNGRILFTIEEKELINKTFEGKKVLTIGNDLLLYSNPPIGNLYKVVILDEFTAK
ncbi:hypothetical protein [Lederbergia graminis]|uniref:Uncharacterized protein n=1 Tax=Lederbergia graminis TaxID=735518 RepID=A0ABW0LGT1_9BACI